MRPPSIVTVSVTNRCNLSCSHCGPALRSSGNGRADEMSRQELSSLFGMLRREGVTHIGITGGEPFVRNDFMAVLNDLSRSGLTCTLLTNGTLLTKERLRSLAATGAVETIRLSIEFPDTKHQPVPRAGNYHSAAETLQTISRCAQVGIRVGVNMTLLPENISLVNKTAAQCRSAGAAFFRMAPVFPMGMAARRQLGDTFPAECVAAAFDLQERFGRMHPAVPAVSSEVELPNLARGCGAGVRLFSIGADGTVSGCPLISEPGKAFHWNDAELSSILGHIRKRITRLQRHLVNSEGGKCKSCSYRSFCRGGCLAEWDCRGRPDKQPFCYVEALEAVMQSDEGRKKAKKYAVSTSAEVDWFLGSKRFNCSRALPLWTVWFSDQTL